MNGLLLCSEKRKLLDVFVLLTNNGNHTSVPSITGNNGLNKAKKYSQSKYFQTYSINF